MPWKGDTPRFTVYASWTAFLRDAERKGSGKVAMPMTHPTRHLHAPMSAFVTAGSSLRRPYPELLRVRLAACLQQRDYFVVVDLVKIGVVRTDRTEICRL